MKKHLSRYVEVYPRQYSVFADIMYENTTQKFIMLLGTEENKELF